MVGDIREINELNRYVGMSAFSTSDVPERKLWILMLTGSLAAWTAGPLLAARALMPRRDL